MRCAVYADWIGRLAVAGGLLGAFCFGWLACMLACRR